jgi:hypothetical protein
MQKCIKFFFANKQCLKKFNEGHKIIMLQSINNNLFPRFLFFLGNNWKKYDDMSLKYIIDKNL